MLDLWIGGYEGSLSRDSVEPAIANKLLERLPNCHAADACQLAQLALGRGPLVRKKLLMFDRLQNQVADLPVKWFGTVAVNTGGVKLFHDLRLESSGIDQSSPHYTAKEPPSQAFSIAKFVIVSSGATIVTSSRA